MFGTVGLPQLSFWPVQGTYNFIHYPSDLARAVPVRIGSSVFWVSQVSWLVGRVLSTNACTGVTHASISSAHALVSLVG